MTIARGKKSGTLYMTLDGFGSVIVVESIEDPNLAPKTQPHKWQGTEGYAVKGKIARYEVC